MSEPLDPPCDTDGRYRYNHQCTGCDGSYEDCQPLWKEQRVCCPDCDHHKAHPPANSSWKQRAAEATAEADEERDEQMEAGHA